MHNIKTLVGLRLGESVLELLSGFRILLGQKGVSFDVSAVFELVGDDAFLALQKTPMLEEDLRPILKKTVQHMSGIAANKDERKSVAGEPAGDTKGMGRRRR
jgi:hypothetical protein